MIYNFKRNINYIIYILFKKMENNIYEENNFLNNMNNPNSYLYNYNNNGIYDENNNFDENELYESENNLEIIQLRNKIEELNRIIMKKNNEIEENRIKYDKQLIQINKTFDNHINEYQKLVENYENIQQELSLVQNEIEEKNKLINELKVNINRGNKFPIKKYIEFFRIIKDKIKNIFFNIFKEENNNEDEFDNILNYGKNNTNNNIEKEYKSIIQLINYLSQKLEEQKYNNENNISEDNNLFPKFYLDFIDIMNNFISKISFNVFQLNDFPKFSLNDSKEKKYGDILLIFNKLTNFIIDNQEENNNTINEINNELNKKLKEMSEVLDNSNKYLNQAKHENAELKMKYNELEQKYLNAIDFDQLNIKLNKDIQKKNQQIRSLENMISILTNKNNNNNATSKSMMMNDSFIGKIVNKKVYNKFINNQNTNRSFYSNNKNINTNFIKDEKNERNLNIFLNKYTNGEYGKINEKPENDTFNNNGIINLKEEIEKYEKGIGYSLSDDEIDKENNYNEEEEEKKYQMEGKI